MLTPWQQLMYGCAKTSCARSDPNRDSLFLYALLRLGPERFFWYVRYHHLCMDGFGGALIAKRVAQVYSSLVQNGSVPPATFQSSFNLIDEEENYRRTELSRDRAYWLAALSDLPDVVTLSGKSPIKSRTFIRQSGCLPTGLTTSLASVGKTFNASLAQVIEAAAAALSPSPYRSRRHNFGAAPNGARWAQDA